MTFRIVPDHAMTDDTFDTSRLEPSFLDRYHIEKLIARGGMGWVYLVHDRLLDRQAAVKFLDEHLDRVAAARFPEEARAHARLKHPHIVTLVTFGGQKSIPYIVFEYVDGPSLAAHLELQGPQPIPQVLAWMGQLAAAMAHAHDKGVLHRDLKPANILLDATSSIRITDFGLARRSARTHDLTRTGDIMGTPVYMSPEQAKGQKACIQSDVYSAGAILYELLTGSPPFSRSSALDTMMAHIHAEVPDPRAKRPDCPTALAAMTTLCLSKSPYDRPANFTAVQQLLTMCASGGYEPSAPTRPSR